MDFSLLTLVLMVVLTPVVVLLKLRRCSSTVVERTVVAGPVPPRFVTLGVELRTGLNTDGHLPEVPTYLEVEHLILLIMVFVLLATTLLNRPLARTMLKWDGPDITKTAAVLTRRQLREILGHLLVIPLMTCRYTLLVPMSMPPPRMRAIRPSCPTVSRKVQCIICLMLQVAPTEILAVILPGALW